MIMPTIDLGHNYHLADARLWLGPRQHGAATRLFRRTITLAKRPVSARVLLYGESTYNAWLNGQFVGRGPAFHHPHRPMLDEFPVQERLNVGRNVLAVLIHWPGHSTNNHVPADSPGMVAQLLVRYEGGDEQVFGVDDQWKASDRAGWRHDAPRRNWALPSIEHFVQADSAGAGEGPGNWTSVSFDDSGWPAAEVLTPATTAPHPHWRISPLPRLEYVQRVPSLLSVYGITQKPEPISAAAGARSIGAELMAAKWTDPSPIRLEPHDVAGAFTIMGLAHDQGAVICQDMGREMTGQVIFECHAASPGIIDVGWSECLTDGRPDLVRKGVSYCDRVEAAGGSLRWQPMHYNAMRYVVLVLRGFEGPVTFAKVRLRESAMALDWRAGPTFSDPNAQAIAKLCVETIRCAAQEGLMDCASREQSVYLADSHLTARWLAQWTGDTRHWRYVVVEQFQRQAPNGLVPSCPFSARQDTMLDFDLLGVIGTRDYWRHTGDLKTVRQLIEPCRRLLGCFLSMVDDSGMCRTDIGPVTNKIEWEYPYDPQLPQLRREDNWLLFIDHPGLGWHNTRDAGIDRRGTNAALNALIVQTQRALAEMEAAIGNDDHAQALGKAATLLARRIRQTCYNPSRGVFIDGIFEGRQLTQISEQTNTWAIAARCCDDDEARRIITKLLTDPDPTIARNGPYFWAYLLPEMARLGMHKLAAERIVTLWKPMIDAGATTLWETFAGDSLDTWSHPWAGAPLEFYLTQILGLPGIDQQGDVATLRPRVDLMKDASGRIFTRHGPVSIAWRGEAGQVVLTGTMPSGMRGRVSVNGQTHEVTGVSWTLAVRENGGSGFIR